MKQSLIFIVILVGIILAYVVDKRNVRKETIWLMDSMYSAKKKIINYDSIKREIERGAIRKIDSLAIREFMYSRGLSRELKNLTQQFLSIKDSLTRLPNTKTGHPAF